jgi:O-succinylbenzoic acid--CoA ligase
MMKGQVHTDFRINGMPCADSEQVRALKPLLDNETAVFLEQWYSECEEIKVMTSGSTGNPKEIELGKKQMLASARATGKFFGLFAGSRALLCLPTKYIAGKMMLVRAMVLGWELDIVEPVSNPLKGLKSSYDFAAMVPLQLENSIEDLHKIKTLIVGGAAVSVPLAARIKSVETKVFATYGMTETITHIAVKPLNDAARIGFKEKFKGDTRNDFFVLTQVEISKDHRDCLVIDAKKITKTPVITNDIVELTGKNTFRLLGRIDHVINSGGIKLYPEMLEEKIQNLIEQPYFFTSLPDDGLGEKLVLVIEGKKKIERGDLQPFLDKYELPREIIALEQFSYTENNKINRILTKNRIPANRQ